MTPTNQQGERKSFRLDKKYFPETRAAMKGRWYMILWFIGFCVSFSVVMDKDIWLGICLFCLVNLVIDWMKIYVDLRT